MKLPWAPCGKSGRVSRGLSPAARRWFFRQATTRVDVLVAIATAGLMAALAMGSHPAHLARRSVCLSHHQQMADAWWTYAVDHGDRLVGNLGTGSLADSNKTWVVGWLDNSQFTADNTNTLLLTAYSPLAPYLNGRAEPFRCPADTSLSHGTTGVARVRSVSMNSYLANPSPWTSGYRLARSLSDLTAPSPSQTYVFVDERPDSLNDSLFSWSMTGYDPRQPSQQTIVDYPADWHDGGASLSFADGHAATWKWQDLRTTPPYRRGVYLLLNVASPNNPDVLRLQEATTGKFR